MAPCFTPRTLAFLRALHRHNRREWFHARRDDYDAHVRRPMLSVIERLAGDFPGFAPDLVATPQSLFRIYRDTRFSDDKRPLKTNVAASFTSRKLPRRAGAGLYFHLDPNTDREVWIGGGIYAPESHDLVRIREHIADRYLTFRAIVESPAFRRVLGALEGAQLARVPRGYPADHPAAAYLKFKQLFAGKSYDVTFATSPRFYTELIRVFRLVAPLVAFLNDPLVRASESSQEDPLAPLLRSRSRRTA
jgi:uncharacterized protein (TIGR02453 family)